MPKLATKITARRTEPLADAWLGPWLRPIREAKGESAAAVAEKLTALGISVDRSRLSLFERGRSEFRTGQVAKVLLAYGADAFAHAAEVHRHLEIARRGRAA